MIEALGIRGLVDQIKFKFERAHRIEAKIFRPFDLRAENIARINVMRCAVFFIHGNQKLPAAGMGQIAKRARHWPAPAITAAASLHKAAIINILATDILSEQGARQAAPGFIDTF